MSSFLVTDETINNLITGLTSPEWTECLMWEYPFKNLEQEDLNKLGRDLIKLNYHALNQRYGNKLKQEDKNGIKQYVFNYEYSNLLQFIKNLDCFLYQCSEGKTINKKLFKVLVKIKNSFYSKVINDLEDYKKAEWGFN